MQFDGRPEYQRFTVMLSREALTRKPPKSASIFIND